MQRQAGRMTELELQLMHLQNDFESLSQVVLKNGRVIDQLREAVKRLTDKLELQQTTSQERLAEDEKPPHY
jgi:uncharacterized coiled-coil protein SlyX